MNEDALVQALQGATPEEQEQILSQLLRTQNIGNQNQLLQSQLEQSLAMQQPSGRQYSTGAGAAFGGLGDVLRSFGGAMGEKKARDQMQVNTSKLEDPNFLSKLLRQGGGRWAGSTRLAGQSIDASEMPDF